MQFYKAKNSEVGEGVEATVIFHKNNGDELICVRSGFEAFEEQNPEVEQITKDEVNDLLAESEVVISVPVKQEIRTDNKLSQEDILLQIQDKENLTADIATSEETDSDGNKTQKITFFEKREIKSVEDFLQAQQDQLKEPEQVQVAEEVAPIEDAEPAAEPIK